MCGMRTRECFCVSGLFLFGGWLSAAFFSGASWAVLVSFRIQRARASESFSRFRGLARLTKEKVKAKVIINARCGSLNFHATLHSATMSLSCSAASDRHIVEHYVYVANNQMPDAESAFCSGLSFAFWLCELAN